MQLDYGTNIPDPIETRTSRSSKKIIPQGYLSRFKRRTRSEMNTYELGYDYGSIMHYNQKAFGKKWEEYNRYYNVLVSRKPIP